jgi:hypothetical protein
VARIGDCGENDTVRSLWGSRVTLCSRSLSLEALGTFRRLPGGVQVDHAHDQRDDRRPIPSEHLGQVEQYLRDLADYPHVLHRKCPPLRTGPRYSCSRHYRFMIRSRTHLPNFMREPIDLDSPSRYLLVKPELNVCYMPLRKGCISPTSYPSYTASRILAVRNTTYGAYSESLRDSSSGSGLRR